MTREELLEKTLRSYAAYYDVNRDCPEEPFVAEAVFHSHNDAYFLVKSARIGEAESNEYVFFASVDNLDRALLEQLDAVAWERGISHVHPHSNHRNTDISLIILASSVAEAALKEDEKSWKDADGVRKFLAHPLVGTTFLVVVGCILGGLSLSQIWGLFGAANQLLAGIALMAVCAWLGQAGKNNKMFYVPMVFMLAATLCSLLITVKNKIVMIGAGQALWGDWFQLIFAAAMAILALFLVAEGVQTFKKQKQAKAAA